VNGWLAPGTWNIALVGAAVCAVIGVSVVRARRGAHVQVRAFPPLLALDRAVADSVAQGRPVFFVAGSQDIDNMQTVAALAVLRPLARKVAAAGGRLFVPTNRSLVMDNAREICRRAYHDAGCADLWRDDWVAYISDDHLGFVARVDGLIARERPGLCVLMGFFASESLLLAEGGHQVGAVQIAGTASAVQLPFLVASCDHVLLGEELFAAGASLEGDTARLGSLRGQDLCKLAAAVCLVAGSLVATLADVTGAQPWLFLRDAFLNVFRAG
jgi:hypothetical protein